MTLNRAISPTTSIDISQDASTDLAHVSRGVPSSPTVQTAGSRLISTILRLPAVKAETGYSRSTIYLRVSQGLWPLPVSLGARSVGWPASEVAAINAARIAGKANSEIRDLVVRLQAARKQSV
jgi:prophage regulatory protein